MADIFISYASEDRAAAVRLADALAGQGWSVWWDPEIPPGETWDEVIEAELDAARCVVVLWSRTSVGKPWVRLEASEGQKRKILVPARIEDVTPPLAFRLIQAAPLMDWQGDPAHSGFRRLVRAVTAKLGAPPVEEPTPRAQTPPKADTKAKTTRERGGATKPKAASTIEAGPSAGADPATLPDLAVFRDIDAPWCPEMVVLPAGTFLMGSPETDKDASPWEKPQHRVTIGARFSVGRYPVTFEEYDRFVDETGSKRPDDRGWGRDRRPVINVSWQDAQAYVEWLGGETGEAYRLLSEAEWEYACRAGTETRYCFGDTITAKQANIDKKVGKTTQVGSYPANPWGLYDLHGNVWEWVEDVWHKNYTGAPDDGRAWTEGGDSGRRVVRGGSWYSGPRFARSALRNGYRVGYRGPRLGFRVARTF
jgi:formylglycine-generating enzyme required for sulfatase activity